VAQPKLSYEAIIWRLAGLRRGQPVHLSGFLDPLRFPENLRGRPLQWKDFTGRLDRTGVRDYHPSREIILHEACHMCLTGHRFEEEIAALLLEYLCLMLLFKPADWSRLSLRDLSDSSDGRFRGPALAILADRHYQHDPHWKMARKAFALCLPEAEPMACAYDDQPARRAALLKAWKVGVDD
jgi:hypothetical protein